MVHMTGFSAAAGTGGNASRRASAITVAVLCILLAAKLAGAFASDQGGQAPFIVALFVLPLLYAVPGTRPLLARYTWQLLAVQGVLTFVPFALFGGQWAQGVAGLLAGLALLTLPGRLSWPLAGLLLVADVMVRAGLVGLPWAPAWSAALWVIVVFVDDGLVSSGWSGCPILSRSCSQRAGGSPSSRSPASGCRPPRTCRPRSASAWPASRR